MSNQYLDEIEKIKYYKEKIVNRYLQKGNPVNKEKVQEYLDKLDLKIAIFSQAYIQSGSKLNTEILNEQKQDIYRDLVILYKVLYDIINNKIKNIEDKIRFMLDDLETKANQFKFLVDSESVSVYGKTIFHQSSGFDQKYKDGQIKIDLGPLDVASGSYLACLFQCKEIDPYTVTFHFDDSTEISAYEYDKRFLKIIGNYHFYTDFYTNEDIIFGKELIEINDTVSDQNRYLFFLNKDKIKVKKRSSSNISYVNFTKGIYYKSSEPEEISFYVYGATQITIDIVGKPSYTNFDGYQIDMPKQRQKIVIKSDNQISIDIKTDGTIYADKAPSVVQNDKLKLFKNFENITDYMVETIQYGDDIHFDDVYIIVDDVVDTLIDIDYIAIKQTQVTELDNE